MTRILSTFLSLILGATLLVSVGCEDEANKTALNSCRSSLESLQKTSNAQVASVNTLKQELVQSQAKVEELTKEVDQLKNPKSSKVESFAAKPSAPTKKRK
jgi:TolA-binding protein